VGRFFNKRMSSAFPFATLAVNLLGAFLLGLIFGSGMDTVWQMMLGTGFMGAFTTFSTFKLENFVLLEHRKWNTLIVYLAASYGGGIFLAFAGIVIGMS
ncbi:MAG TPA: CrcB family protein, partial [Bacillales bacterium]|nr:CrcB family protein [Bacillales bacterium]